MNGRPLSQRKAQTSPKSLDIRFVCSVQLSEQLWWIYQTKIINVDAYRNMLVIHYSCFLVPHQSRTCNNSYIIITDHETTTRFLWFWVDCDQFSVLQSNVNTFSSCLLFLEYCRCCRERSQLLS